MKAKNKGAKSEMVEAGELWLNLILSSSSSSSGFAPTILEPEFVKEIGNITMPAGRDVKLACTVKNLGSYKVSVFFYTKFS
ncbi:hypothetical protein TKK_0003865 [Trichogramma kaykai]